MTNDTKIQPAMTPEEWAEAQNRMREHAVSADHARADLVEAALDFWVQNSPITRVTDPQYHRIAALALHGQPFGFTHEDVRRLLVAADREEETMAYMGSRGHSTWRGLADRIAALLPPESHQ